MVSFNYENRSAAGTGVLEGMGVDGDYPVALCQLRARTPDTNWTLLSSDIPEFYMRQRATLLAYEADPLQRVPITHQRISPPSTEPRLLSTESQKTGSGANADLLWKPTLKTPRSLLSVRPPIYLFQLFPTFVNLHWRFQNFFQKLNTLRGDLIAKRVPTSASVLAEVSVTSP